MPLDLRELSLSELESLMKVHLANRPEPTWALGEKPAIPEFAAWQRKLGPWNDRKDQIQYHLDLRTVVVSKPFVKAEELPAAEVARIEASLSGSEPNRESSIGIFPPKPAKRTKASHSEVLHKLHTEHATAEVGFVPGTKGAAKHIHCLRREINNLRGQMGMEPAPFLPLPKAARKPRAKGQRLGGMPGQGPRFLPKVHNPERLAEMVAKERALLAAYRPPDHAAYFRIYQTRKAIKALAARLELPVPIFQPLPMAKPGRKPSSQRHLGVIA